MSFFLSIGSSRREGVSFAHTCSRTFFLLYPICRIIATILQPFPADPTEKRPAAARQAVRSGRLFHLRDVADDLDALVNAERAAVEADVVIFGLAPVAVGVVLVIDLALAVLLLQAFFHGFARLAVALAHAGSTVGHVGVDENVQAVRSGIKYS